MRRISGARGKGNSIRAPNSVSSHKRCSGRRHSPREREQIHKYIKTAVSQKSRYHLGRSSRRHCRPQRVRSCARNKKGGMYASRKGDAAQLRAEANRIRKRDNPCTCSHETLPPNDMTRESLAPALRARQSLLNKGKEGQAMVSEEKRGGAKRRTTSHENDAELYRDNERRCRCEVANRSSQSSQLA